MKVKRKKFKSGKIRRHKFKKAAGLKTGFGKPWSAPSIPFRVEFCYENPDSRWSGSPSRSEVGELQFAEENERALESADVASQRRIAYGNRRSRFAVAEQRRIAVGNPLGRVPKI